MTTTSESALTQYLDVLDELIFRAEEISSLGEENGRQAHQLLAGRVAQTLRDEVYSFDLATTDLSRFVSSPEQRAFIARTTALIEVLERGILALEPLSDISDDDDLDEEPEDADD